MDAQFRNFTVYCSPNHRYCTFQCIQLQYNQHNTIQGGPFELVIASSCDRSKGILSYQAMTDIKKLIQLKLG